MSTSAHTLINNHFSFVGRTKEKYQKKSPPLAFCSVGFRTSLVRRLRNSSGLAEYRDCSSVLYVVFAPPQTSSPYFRPRLRPFSGKKRRVSLRLKGGVWLDDCFFDACLNTSPYIKVFGSAFFKKGRKRLFIKKVIFVGWLFFDACLNTSLYIKVFGSAFFKKGRKKVFDELR